MLNFGALYKFWATIVAIGNLYQSTLLFTSLVIVRVTNNLAYTYRWSHDIKIFGHQIHSPLLSLTWSLLLRVLILCFPLSPSSSRTGLNKNGGGSGVFSKGLSSPYFLKYTRHSVQSKALSLPAWCQSLEAEMKRTITLSNSSIQWWAWKYFGNSVLYLYKHDSLIYLCP